MTTKKSVDLEDAILELAAQQAVRSCLVTTNRALKNPDHQAMVSLWLQSAVHAGVQCMVCEHIWHPADKDHELRLNMPGAFFFVMPAMREDCHTLVSPVCQRCAVGEPQQVADKCHKVLNEMFCGCLEVVPEVADSKN